MNYYTQERIGPKQSLTKEKFLLCEECPIARTGQMVYGDGEIPLAAGPDGKIIVDRFPEDVFRPETMASFNGKDIVDEHPDEDVKPDNWRQLTAGVVLNVRRGLGAQDDVILADLLVKDPSVIDAIRGGKRELSCGYDADYIQALSEDGVTPIPGRGRQINILGNHVALVEAGRCGPRCAIGDSQNKELNMTWIDKVKAAFVGKDEAAFNAALAEAPKETGTHVHVHTVDAKEDEEDNDKGKTKDAAIVDKVFADKRFTDVADNVARIADAFEKEDEEDEDDKKKKKETEDANRQIEGNLEMEAPPGTSDGVAGKARDSAYLVDSFQEAISLAEIIAPGIQVPTVDAKDDPKKTFDSLCRFRKTVLDLASAQPDLRGFMDVTTGGRDYKTYDCNGVRTLFRAVGVHKKMLNNASARSADHSEIRTSGGGVIAGAITSPADLNKRMADFYKNN